MKKSIAAISTVLVLCIAAMVGAGSAVNEFYFHCDNADTLQKAVEQPCANKIIVIDSPITLDKQIDISKRDVVIDLNGNSISANSNCRLFFIHDGGSLYMYNGNLCGGYAKYDAGGAIFVRDAFLEMKNVKISNCQAQEGGGVAGIDSDCILIDTEISNCKVDDSKWQPNYLGGGVFGKNSDFTIKNCIVKDCLADDNGGGVYFERGNCIIEDSKIINCKADDSDGGGFYSKECELEMLRCTIEDCVAYLYGGGIHALAQESKCLLTDVTISKCKVNSGSGGAISVMGSKGRIFEMLRCTIADCYADKFGGGIYACKGCDAILDGVSISNCKCKRDGGGIKLYKNAKVEMKNGSIKGCKADDDGDAVDIGVSATFVQENCKIDGEVYKNKLSD